MATQTKLYIFADGTAVYPDYVKFESNSSQQYHPYGAVNLDTEGTAEGYQKKVCLDKLGFYDISFAATPTNGFRYSVRVQHLGVDFSFVRTLATGTVETVHLLLPTNQNHWTSQAEVVRLLGSLAVDLMLEDVSGTENHWEQALSYADETIEVYISEKYDKTTNIANPFLRRRATYLAARQMSQRRGNPGLFLREYVQVLDELKMIHDGELKVPGGTPLGYQGPVIRNYTMQPSIYFPQRIQIPKSTGDSYGGEKLAVEPYLWIR